MQVPDGSGKFSNLKFRLNVSYLDIHRLHEAISVQLYKLPESETNIKLGLYLGQVNIFWKQCVNRMQKGEPKTFQFEAGVCDPSERATCEVQGMLQGHATWIPFGY